jgi:hypothetical protein
MTMTTISSIIRHGDVEHEVAVAKATVNYWRLETKVRSMECRSFEFTQARLQEACADLCALEEVAALLNG